MQKLKTLLHIIDAICEWTGKVTSFAIVLIIGIMLWLVLTRYVLHISTAWTYATATKVLFIYVIFGAAYALRSRVYVNVDILYGHLTLRARSIIDLITYTAIFLFCLALLWVSVETAARDAALRVHLSFRSFLPPNWPITIVAPAGLLLFFLQGLSKFIRDLVTAITGKEIT